MIGECYSGPDRAARERPRSAGRAAHGPRRRRPPCAVRPPTVHHQVALGGHVGGRPLELPSASSTRTGVPERGAPGRRSAACRPGPDAVPRSSTRGSRAAEQGVEQPATGRRTRPVQLAQRVGRSRPGSGGRSSSVRRPVHVDPDPHHDRVRGSRRAAAGTGQVGLGQHPGQLAAVAAQQVVGPLDPHRPAPATRGDGVGRGQGHHRAGQVPVRRAAGRAGAAPTPAGWTRRRLPAPTEPAPARRLVVGHRHHALGRPRRASSSRYRLVESIESNRRMSVNRVPGMAHTLRAVPVSVRASTGGMTTAATRDARSDSKGAAC